MNEKSIGISEAEWEVMKVLWAHDGLTATETMSFLDSRRRWNHRTVKTLISRLVKKGAIRFHQEGQRYRYFPAITRNEAVRAEAVSFLDRVFDGMTLPMLSHFVASSKLNKDEIAELKRMLDDKADRDPSS